MYNVEEQAKAIQELRKGIINKAAALVKKNLEYQVKLGDNEARYVIDINCGCYCFLDVRISDSEEEGKTLHYETLYVFDSFNSNRFSLSTIEDMAAVLAGKIDDQKKVVMKYINLNLKELKEK